MYHIKTCGNCNKEASLLCTRCLFEYYCSKNCQIIDFPRHRAQCFSLPSLAPITPQIDFNESTASIATSANNDGEQVKNSSLAETKIQHPRVVLENKLSKTSVTESPKRIVENRASSNASLKDKQEQQKPPLQQQQLNKVLFTPAFDQGIRTPAPNTYQNPTPVKPPTSHASLSKRSEVSTQNLVEGIEKVASTAMSKIQSIRRNQQTVLTDQPLIKPKDTRTYIADMTRRALKPGKNRVTITTAAGDIFYVVESIAGIDDYFQHIEANIKTFIESDKTVSYQPAKNEVVLAKFENDYFRAVCKGIKEGNPTTYQVFFLDYGNSLDDVKEEDIRPLGPKLKSEITLHGIRILNMPKNVTKEIAALFENPEGFEVEVQEQDSKSGIYSVNVCGI